MKTIDFHGKTVSIQNIWDAMPSIRYNILLFVGISTLMIPLEVLMYYHPVFTTGEVTWKCLKGTLCEQIYNTTGDARCHVRDTSQWTYTSPQVTVVQDFNWICEREFYYTLYNSFYFVGYMLGLPFSGMLSDWYGRSRSHMVVISVVFVALVCMSVAQTTLWLLCGQIMLGFGAGSMWTIGYIRRMELIPSKYRNWANCSMCIIELTSFLFALLLSMWLENWRHTLIMAALLCTINITLVAFPDSPQSLVARNKTAEARALLDYISFNNSAVIRNYELEQHQKNKLGYRDLMFRNATVTKYFVVMCLAWFSSSLISYSIQYIALNLPGDGLWNFVIIMQVPMLFTVAIKMSLVDYLGRKFCLLMSFLTSAVGLLGGLLLGYYQINNAWLSLAAFGVAKVSSGLSFGMVYLMTTELFPTLLRQQALSGCSTIARIGAISGPIMSYFQKLFPTMTLTVLIVVSLLIACLGTVIPETNGRPLLDSYEDLVNYERVETEGEEEKQKLVYNYN